MVEWVSERVVFVLSFAYIFHDEGFSFWERWKLSRQVCMSCENIL